jgi:hypothetical protein
MTNDILTIGIPTLAVLIGILVNNSRLSDLRTHMDQRFTANDQRFADLMALMNARFDQAHSELIRVEQVLDARLKHVERS